MHANIIMTDEYFTFPYKMLTEKYIEYPLIPNLEFNNYMKRIPNHKDIEHILNRTYKNIYYIDLFKSQLIK